MNTPLSRLRTIGIYEGFSSLVLFGIAMPLKYMAGMPEAVKYVGWAHGVLFILYILAVVQVTFVHKWSLVKVAGAFFASLIPLGPFIFDKKFLKPEEERLAAEKAAKQLA
nr:DUF3817 domain-containing protein [Pontibacter ruber]